VRPKAAAERIAYVLRTSGRGVTDDRSGTRRERLDLYAAARLIRDGRRPTLTSRTPEPGASGVALSAHVLVTFSERVSGVNGASLILRDARGFEVPASVDYDAASHRATLVAAAELEAGATYAVTLTNAIRDAAGNRLRTSTWTFTTRA
jgi:hypothetical protein